SHRARGSDGRIRRPHARCERRAGGRGPPLRRLRRGSHRPVISLRERRRSEEERLVRRWDVVALIAGMICVVLVATPFMHASPAGAQPSEIAKAAAEPIMKQLEAFRRGDYDAAYVFASTEIKQMFDRPAFERMVKGGYPEIAQSTSAVVAGTEM